MSGSHWTARSPEDFLYSIASDFVEQLRAKMKTLGLSQSELALAAKVSKSYVSQVFNDPGNLSLITIVKFAKAVGMKVSIVGYEQSAKEAETVGPINSEVFRLCWERQGKPIDLWSFKEQNVATTSNTIDVKTFMENHVLGMALLRESQPTNPTPKSSIHQLTNYVNEKTIQVKPGGSTYTGWAKY